MPRTATATEHHEQHQEQRQQQLTAHPGIAREAAATAAALTCLDSRPLRALAHTHSTSGRTAVDIQSLEYPLAILRCPFVLTGRHASGRALAC